MSRFAYKAVVAAFISHSDDEILGQLAASHKQRHLEQQQRNAWKYQICALKAALAEFPEATLVLEFEIPRLGKRIDAVLIFYGAILLLEYKVGAKSFDASSIDQVCDYALDLKNFHQASHHLNLFPILIATEAPNTQYELVIDSDGIAKPILANSRNFSDVLRFVVGKSHRSDLDPTHWANSSYQPTPTIVEAAMALYKGHKVEEISRSDAGAINLTTTSNYISNVIEDAKQQKKKVICLVTGTPGAGKSLVGLNLATARMRVHDQEYAVFLSGNGPLVAVLREALVLDQLAASSLLPKEGRIKRKSAEQNAATFIQNIHHFRDDNLKKVEPPIEKVVIFDEAQRAWNKEQTSSFMKRKRDIADFDKSEPDFLLSVMNRHEDWCVVVCLVGGGQEINTGEAGMTEWISTLRRSYQNWEIHASKEIFSPEYALADLMPVNDASDKLHWVPELHLDVSLRSFRAEKLSAFVGAIVLGNADKAREIKQDLSRYPIFVSRDLAIVKDRLKKLARGSERIGLIASSNASRLKPSGVFVKGEIDPTLWFLKGRHDVRSSYFLEDIATEFDIQGLEIDWAGVCWDANFRMEDGKWATYQFTGTKWQTVRDAQRQKYLANAYRVLLTRGRQGIVIFIPHGDDSDHTRKRAYYDQTFSFLLNCGIEEI